MKYVRCKVCGYIMEEGKLKDKCPACGLPRQVFEPYSFKLAAKRKFVLDQHLHPIAVHFPQVFILLSVALPILALVLGAPWSAKLFSASELVILALPFTVLLGLLSGLFDGKVRFKRLNAPLLISKMVVGVLLQALSVAMLVLYLYTGFDDLGWLIALGILATFCSIYLGKAGADLFGAYLPG